MTLTPDLISRVTERVNLDFPAAIAELSNLVRINGIAWDALDQTPLQQSADAVANALSSLDIFELVTIRRAKRADTGKPGAPAVVAQRKAKNGKPQILLYAHHDVQPAGDESIWQSPPFEPTLRDGRIFGRGAADDKAGIASHLAALRSLKAIAGADFDLGITLFIEGEEEAGSPSFKNFLLDNRDVLAADVIVVADSTNWSVEVPALTATLRGLVSQVITVKTLDHALHSGMFGGAIPDAMTAMLRLLASLHDSNGDVAIEGLKRGTAAPLDYDEARLRAESGMLDATELMGTGTILDRIWNKPAVTVIGLDAPSVAMSSNTLLPSVSAKISLRIAPGDDPETALAALRGHLERHIPWGAALEYGAIEQGKPFTDDPRGWAKPSMQQALTAAWGTEAVDIGVGGSIPFIADLTEVFPDAQILVTGVEDPDSRAHSPNESIHLETLKRAMLAESLWLISLEQG